MADLDLHELEAIKRLKYAYMRCIDQKLWEELETLFTEDATSSYGGGKYTYEGRDAIMKFLVDSMSRESFLSSHTVHHPEIDFVSETEATGTWKIEDVVVDEQFGLTIRGAAFYVDRYVKQDGAWKIRHTGYKRTYEEIEPRKDKGITLTAHWWKTDGRSNLPGPS